MEIFENLAGFKGCEFLPQGQFYKIGRIEGLTNESFILPTYDIIFSQIVCKEETKRMNFECFIEALELVSNKLYNSPYDIKAFSKLIEIVYTALFKSQKK